jgi:hypothetical protein
MKEIVMKNRYRKFRRGNVWWCQDNQTGKQNSLKTKSEDEAIDRVHFSVPLHGLVRGLGSC